MNSISLYPRKMIDGEVLIPPSKSISQRVLALAILSGLEIEIFNIGKDADTLSAIQIGKEFGLVYYENENSLHITGDSQNKKLPEIIDCGESGLSTRLFSCFSLLTEEEVVITGKGSVMNRSMDMIIAGLQQFGKRVESNQGKLPLKISGKIIENKVTIDGSISSQFLTGLLLVCPFLPFDTNIFVKDLKSVPYVQLTLQLLDDFGIEYTRNSFEEFRINGRQIAKQRKEYAIEGDWSSASYFIVAGAIGGRMVLKGLNKDSTQADKVLLSVVERMGAKLTWKDGNLIIQKNRLSSFEFDATNCPDLFPALAVLASVAEGDSIIRGVTRLFNKESNRSLALQTECAKVGVVVKIIGDTMVIKGNARFYIDKEVVFSSHNDHRIAMAMSLYTIFSTRSIIIENAEAVSKSYPSFFDDFRRS